MKFGYEYGINNALKSTVIIEAILGLVVAGGIAFSGEFQTAGKVLIGLGILMLLTAISFVIFLPIFGIKFEENKS